VKDVAAVTFGVQPERLLAAVRDQVAETASAESLGAIHEAVRSVRAPLVWLLDARATPSGGTLAALLEQGYEPAVSMPVDEAGAPVEAVLGRFTESDKEGILKAVNERRLPLRHTYVLSMLIARELVLDEPAPDPPRFGVYAGTEWTARVFARKRGMLIPASRVRVPADMRGSLRDALRMARTGVWRRGETLRELHRAAVGGR
jgi:hypothetical protein